MTGCKCTKKLHMYLKRDYVSDDAGESAIHEHKEGTTCNCQIESGSYGNIMLNLMEPSCLLCILCAFPFHPVLLRSQSSYSLHCQNQRITLSASASPKQQENNDIATKESTAQKVFLD